MADEEPFTQADMQRFVDREFAPFRTEFMRHMDRDEENFRTMATQLTSLQETIRVNTAVQQATVKVNQEWQESLRKIRESWWLKAGTIGVLLAPVAAVVAIFK